MLTLLEATNAIKALDTEPDIILNACRDILYPEKKDMDQDAPELLAMKILERFGDVGPSKMILALATAIGVSGAIAAKKGKEREMIKHILAAVQHVYMAHLRQRLEKEFEENPEAALENLLALMRQLRE